MSPIVTVTFGNVSARGRFLNPDGTMNMTKLRDALDLPDEVDLGTLNFLVPQSMSIAVSTNTWTLTVKLEETR
ncbi:hypothetical protein [Mycolicibacterium fallax]|uniref:Uncharacterized protein n=1 Tax=Mycolicibacterium fallax TaxID=1793 RepID=A0A1X1RN41_MYCFA|nr:hypothetical protein [Mycolicibacterium fallax]ORV10041.1 hypothetical protein AWC04_01035 [Mycolicibacterium fallax]BBY98349.1 hypothetical protein MFAL_18160 [Mycolicibacterium fallax]